MRKLFFIVLFLNTINLFPQGFDWQISPRFPVGIPSQFYGIGFDYSLTNHFGNFNLVENQIPCCTFQDGTGTRYGVSLYYENWLNGTSSFNLSLTYNYLKSNFEIQSVVPTREGDFITRYDFDSKIHFIGIGGFFKKRIPKYKINFSGGLNFLVNLSNSQTHTEYGITNNVPFRERNLSSGSINESNLLLIEPFIQAGTDLDLGIGMYASPNIKLGYTLNSYIQDDSWRSFTIGLNLRIYRSFDLKLD